MKTYSTVSKLIFAGMTTFALSATVMAASQDNMTQKSMEDDAPTSTTDQEGMAGKDSANQEPIKQGMGQDSMSSDQGMGMDQEDSMTNDQPMDSNDQEGMESKDSANHESMSSDMSQDSMSSDQGMGMDQEDSMTNDQPMDSNDQEGMESKDSSNHEEVN